MGKNRLLKYWCCFPVFWIVLSIVPKYTVGFVTTRHNFHNNEQNEFTKRVGRKDNFRLEQRHVERSLYRTQVFAVDDDDDNNDKSNCGDNFVTFLKQNSRRNFIQSFGLASIFCSYSKKASAMGLAKFPCKYRLANTYHFLRVGQSLLEEVDVWSTNPLFLTNREAALSPLGFEQVQNACKKLKSDKARPTIVRYSLAAASMDSADIVGNELKIGRDSLVPEFNFMDPRALGRWDMLPLNVTEAAVWAMDNDEAGEYGLGGRPPANEDGTPHETLGDQAIRLRQLFSVLESQYAGDTVLLVFPDGTGPALLECMIAGIPLNKVHELNYKPGEIRLDITYDNVRARMPTTVSDEFSERLSFGREELVVLRKNPDEIINVKDKQYEEELRQYNEKKAMMDMQKQKEAEEKERAKEQLRNQVKKERELKIQSSPDNQSVTIAGIGALAAGGGALLVTSGGDNDENSKNATSITSVVEVDEGIDKKDVESITLESDIKNGNLTNVSEKLPMKHTDTIDSTVQKIFDVDQSLDGGSYFNNVSDRNTKTTESAKKNGEDRKNIEKKKMVYLDIENEDGGDAWLGMLSDIITEEENEVDDRSAHDVEF